MCGIAGFSVRPGSGLERTLAAQALLAGIAERGADAVGYAYRRPREPYATVVKQRTPASQLLDRVSVPDDVERGQQLESGLGGVVGLDRKVGNRFFHDPSIGRRSADLEM